MLDSFLVSSASASMAIARTRSAPLPRGSENLRKLPSDVSILAAAFTRSFGGKTAMKVERSDATQ